MQGIGGPVKDAADHVSRRGLKGGRVRRESRLSEPRRGTVTFTVNHAGRHRAADCLGRPGAAAIKFPVCRPRGSTRRLEAPRPAAVGGVDAFRLLSPRPGMVHSEATDRAASPASDRVCDCVAQSFLCIEYTV